MKKLAVGILLCLSFGVIAKEGGNGGFAYTNSITLLEVAKDRVIEKLSSINATCINVRLKGEGLSPIKLTVMIQSIKNLKMSFAKTKEAVNPAGIKLPLMFSYGSDENGINYIEALQPFFLAYMTNAYSRSELAYKTRNCSTERPCENVNSILLEVEAALIHESSHFLNYSELDAEKLKEIILSIYETREC